VWPSKRFWHSPQGARIRAEDLKSFPTLAAYLSSMTLFPRVAEKIHHYSTSPTGFDEIALVVFYANALAYNSPAETPWFSFSDAAEKLGIKLRPLGFGVFNKVFLFIATEPPKVFPIRLAGPT
jgi:hypothetical protein